MVQTKRSARRSHVPEFKTAVLAECCAGTFGGERGDGLRDQRESGAQVAPAYAAQSCRDWDLCGNSSAQKTAVSKLRDINAPRRCLKPAAVVWRWTSRKPVAEPVDRRLGGALGDCDVVASSNFQEA